MTNLNQAMETIKTAVNNGSKNTQAIILAENEVIHSYTKERTALMDRLAYKVTVHARNKDKGSVMKLFHAAKGALEANAEKVNADLSTLAAGISTAKFTWTAKVQQPLVVRVALGEKTKMSGQAGHETEFKGFSGDDIVTFFMSQKKDYWSKRAGNAVLKQLSEHLKVESFKDLWREVGRIAREAALFEEYARVEHTESGTPRVVTDKLLRLEAQLDRRENDISYASSNHYVEELADDIRDYEKRLDSWEASKAEWDAVTGRLVGEFNEIQEWAGEEIRLPVGDLTPMHEWTRKATLEGIESAVAETETFRTNVAKQQELANATLEELLA